MNKHTLIIDNQNFLHRAKKGLNLGPNFIVFNYLRNLRSLISTMKNVTDVCIVLEGHPKHRYKIDSEYKGTRRQELDNEQKQIQQDFYRQCTECIKIVQKILPVTVVKHKDYECDDTIFNLCKTLNSDKITVVSNDTDFIQLLNQFEKVSLYDPMRKVYREKVNYDYITWKSLRGDPGDNIIGFSGIGDKKAEKLALNSEELSKFLSISENQIKFNRNFELISFKEFNKEELLELEIQNYYSLLSSFSWQEELKEKFVELGFKSLLEPKSFNKFIKTFEELVI